MEYLDLLLEWKAISPISGEIFHWTISFIMILTDKSYPLCWILLSWQSCQGQVQKRLGRGYYVVSCSNHLNEFLSKNGYQIYENVSSILINKEINLYRDRKWFSDNHANNFHKKIKANVVIIFYCSMIWGVYILVYLLTITHSLKTGT